jgi:hypothetical protein
LIISRVNNQGFQTAQIIISDVFVNCFKSLVLLLQLITVAEALIKSIVNGFHTILLFHITVIIFHHKSIFRDFNISITHAGVQGTSQELSHIKSFH